MAKKCIITAALLGNGTTKEMNPNVPYTADEIGIDAVKCVKAGASIIHIHVRNSDGTATNDVAIYKAAVDAIQERLDAEKLDAIINISTGNFNPDDEYRIQPVRDLKPEICSYNPGTINWGQKVYLNTPQYMRSLGLAAIEAGTKPEIEIFDTAMFRAVRDGVKEGFLKDPCHFQFIMGVPSGMECTIENVAFLHSLMPAGGTWSITGVGKSHMDAMMFGLAAGADGIRTGLEDGIWLKKGVLATNETYTQQAVELAIMAGREIATAEDAREILSMKPRR